MMNNEDYHIPVLAEESVNGLNIKKDGTYVDATFGGGGHSRIILEKLENGRLFVFDQDEDARNNLWEDERITFVNQNFRHLKRYLRLFDALPVDGILADLGISSHQIDTPERGFSTRFSGDLDMRMDQSLGFTAADILNTYAPDELTRVLKEFGEIANARQVAKTIVRAREDRPIQEIDHFKSILSPFSRGREHKFLAQVFQALRIEVNAEMKALEEFLESTADVVRQGGRLVIISYHSLEDRQVKNFIKAGNVKGTIESDVFGNIEAPFKAVNRKPMLPTNEEIDRNSRSRSAKLRIAERV